MARSIKKGPYVFARLLKKVQKLNEEGKKEVISTKIGNIIAPKTEWITLVLSKNNTPIKQKIKEQKSIIKEGLILIKWETIILIPPTPPKTIS